MEKAAENQSGTAGAGMGMGMGFAMANQMGQTFVGGQQQATPPALTFYAVINGQQAGPYDMSTLKQMAKQNQLNKEILVWREGMANWTSAGQVPELNDVFGSVPPPIPGK